MIERMSLERAPVTALAPHSALARAYRAPWSEITAPDQGGPVYLQPRPGL